MRWPQGTPLFPYGMLNSLRLSMSAAMIACIPAVAVAQDTSDHCRQFGHDYHYLAKIPACLSFRTDIKTDYRARSSRKELSVDADRDASGALLSYSLATLGPDRPLARHLFEFKPLLNFALLTDQGPLVTSFGFKYQLETPPRRPGDPTNSFNRTGERTVLEHANVRFWNVMVGVAPSFFDFTPTLGYTTLYASEQSGLLAAYTHKIGTTDISVALEDGSYRRLTESAWGAYQTRQFAPDVVGQIRKRFPWGTVQTAAAVHPVRAIQPAVCCEQVRGEAVGFAVMGGIEAWFDVAGMSAELLLNGGFARGSLSYLGVTNYPADFAISRSGAVFLTDSQAIVAAYAHWWTKQFRTVFTFSGFRTKLDTDTFRLSTEGLRLQGAFEYYPQFVPRRRLLLGIEINYHDESVGGASGTSIGRVGNRYFSSLGYARYRFQR